MPPARQADRVTQSREPDLARQADGVLLGGPQRVGGHRVLDPEPVPAGRRVPGPVQPRVVGQDLHARADDEHEEEQVEEVLPARPGGKARRGVGVRRRDRPRVARDEALHRWVVAQALGHGDRDQQEHEADRQQPEEVEPAAATDPHARADPVDVRNRARERGNVDGVLAGRQLPAVAAHQLRRHARRRRSARIFTVGFDAAKPTPGLCQRLASSRRPCASIATNTTVHSAKATHTHTRAKLTSD